jgi:hypothetical protein
VKEIAIKNDMKEILLDRQPQMQPLSTKNLDLNSFRKILQNLDLLKNDKGHKIHINSVKVVRKKSSQEYYMLTFIYPLCDIYL